MLYSFITFLNAFYIGQLKTYSRAVSLRKKENFWKFTKRQYEVLIFT